MSCKDKIENYYYPSFEKVKEKNLDTLKLETFKNYEDLLNKLENINYKGAEYSLLHIENKRETYNLMLTTRHGFCFSSRMVKRNNLITICEDSILKNDKLFHVNQLSDILEKDLKNNGKNVKYADNTDSLIISLALKNPENFKHLEKYLINIIEKFNELNINKEYQLNLQIDRKFFFYRDLFKNLPK